MLKLWYFGYLMWRDNSLERKDLDAGEDFGQEEKRATKGETAEWQQQQWSEAALGSLEISILGLIKSGWTTGWTQ